MSSSNLRTELPLLALLALLWGSSYLFIKVAVAEIPPVTLIALRVLGATIFLLLVMGARSERLPRDARTWRMLLVQSVLNSIGAWTVLAWGQQYVESGLASVLNSTSPIIVFLITALVTRHEALGGRKLAGAVLGLMGVALIVGVDVLRGLGDQVAGQVACLVGAALYAGAAIYGKRFNHISAVATATGTMIWASLVLVPFALVLDRPWTLAPSPTALVATAILSILGTGVALLIYFHLVRTLGSMGVASQSYL
ncbi:MAG: EamA family transporter, partial [Pseudomonadota bacterium]